MKKLFVQDKKNRKNIKNLELQYFILKQIAINFNHLKIIRWNALLKLSNISKKNSKIIISKRCIKTFNKKTFHKFTNFSRTFFLKLVQSGFISGMRKSSW